MQPAATEHAEMDQSPPNGLVYGVVASCALVSLYFALVDRSGVFLFVDEFHSLANLDRGYGFLFSTVDARGSGIALPLLQRLAVDLFGESLFAYRLPAALGAMGTTLLCYPVAKRLVGSTPGLICVIALCANSFFIYYSRLGRSYTIAMLVVLGVVMALQLALSAGTPQKRHFAALALLIGLAPFVHLVTVGVIALVLAAALATLAIRGDAGSQLRWLMGSIGVGGVIAILLHLPAIEEIISFFDDVVSGTRNQYVHDATFVAIVAETLAGGRAAALVLWVGVPVAAIRFALLRRTESLTLIAAAFSSLLMLLILTPRGAPVAWARYLLVSLPFFLMLLSWLVIEIARHLPIPPAARPWSAPLLAIGLVIVGFALGPLGLQRVDDGPFSNGYLSTRPRAASDVPWPETPGFYRELAASAEDAVVIEAPVLSGRSSQLYRNYYLQHQKEVLMGALDVPDAEVSAPVWPYIDLLEPGAIRGSGADYLIVHLNVEAEAVAYETFVNRIDPMPRARRSGTPGTRHGLLLNEYARTLETELGAPHYRDQNIAAWRL